ncbi:hypothetical protein LPB138_13245 [Urechidicola croceus]|uniref:Uncharacterized protein n=2 Tax=Urechidicola croceus TaxID=1850246 RepID=A0A1D8PAF7_9FLAO|nr:hypothetical protein LPB138_13245 [Urechidicola croceus]
MIFFIAIALIKIILGFFRFSGFKGLQDEYFADGKWQYFLISNLVMSFIYGLLMAGYYKFIKK